MKCPTCDQPWDPTCPYCLDPVTNVRTAFIDYDEEDESASYWHKKCWNEDQEC